MRALLVYKSITICLSISLELYTDLFGLSLSNLWRFQDLSFLVWSHLPNLWRFGHYSPQDFFLSKKVFIAFQGYIWR